MLSGSFAICHYIEKSAGTWNWGVAQEPEQFCTVQRGEGSVLSYLSSPEVINFYPFFQAHWPVIEPWINVLWCTSCSLHVDHINDDEEQVSLCQSALVALRELNLTNRLPVIRELLVRERAVSLSQVRIKLIKRSLLKGRTQWNLKVLVNANL